MQNLSKLKLVSIILCFALIIMSVLWEWWLSPLRQGGSWLILKAFPLVLTLPGLIKGRRYTYQWSAMLILLYILEGLMRFNDAGISAWLARSELLLALALLITTSLYARASAPSRISAK